MTTMFGKTKAMMIAITMTMFFITACSDDVDKTLDNFDTLVETYEQKAKEKPIDQADVFILKQDFKRLEHNFETTVNIPQKNWKPEQRARLERIKDRYNALAYN